MHKCMDQSCIHASSCVCISTCMHVRPKCCMLIMMYTTMYARLDSCMPGHIFRPILLFLPPPPPHPAHSYRHPPGCTVNIRYMVDTMEMMATKLISLRDSRRGTSRLRGVSPLCRTRRGETERPLSESGHNKSFRKSDMSSFELQHISAISNRKGGNRAPSIRIRPQ